MRATDFTPNTTLRGKIRKESYSFWCNYLFNIRLASVFKFTVPETWDRDYLFHHLFYHGFLPVVHTEFGALPLEGTLHGNNPYHKPSMARVINRGEGWDIDVDAVINKDCVVLAPFEDYIPHLNPVIAEYAYSLANMSTTMDMSILNSRLAYCFAAKDKQSANTIKDIMDRVYNGEPAVTYMKLLGRPDDHSDTENWNFVELHPNNAYIGSSLIADRETLLKEFDTIIGLPSMNNKKERMLTDEVEVQNSGNFSIAQRIVDTLTEQFDRANAMFGLNLKVELRKGEGNIGSKNDIDGVANS